MSNKAEVPTEALEWILNCWPKESTAEIRAVLPRQVIELRALLSTLAVERQENICTHPDGCMSCSWCGFKAAPTKVTGELRLESMTAYKYQHLQCTSDSCEMIYRQSAPVAVVLPIRQPKQNCDYTEGWNACIDKTKELNQ